MSDTTSRPHPDNSFWAGLFLGGILGGLIIALLGTEKGKKLVKKIEEEGLDFLDETKDKIAEKIPELEHKGQELVERGKELVQEGRNLEEKLAEKIVEAKADMTQQALAQADSALEHIEKLQQHGRNATAELRKRLFKNITKTTRA